MERTSRQDIASMINLILIYLKIISSKTVSGKNFEARECVDDEPLEGFLHRWHLPALRAVLSVRREGGGVRGGRNTLWVRICFKDTDNGRCCPLFSSLTNIFVCLLPWFPSEHHLRIIFDFSHCQNIHSQSQNCCSCRTAVPRMSRREKEAFGNLNIPLPANRPPFGFLMGTLVC